MNLSTYAYGANAPPCSIVTTDDCNFGHSFAIKQTTKGAITNAQFTSFYLSDTGQVGIGTTAPSYLLDVQTTTCSSRLMSTGVADCVFLYDCRA